MVTMPPERVAEFLAHSDRVIDQYHSRDPNFFPQGAVDLQKSLFRRFVQIRPDQCNNLNATVSAALALKFFKDEKVVARHEYLLNPWDIALLYGIENPARITEYERECLILREIHFLQIIGWVIEPLTSTKTK